MREPKRTKPMRQPRYDDVYDELVEWVESLAHDLVGAPLVPAPGMGVSSSEAAAAARTLGGGDGWCEAGSYTLERWYSRGHAATVVEMSCGEVRWVLAPHNHATRFHRAPSVEAARSAAEMEAHALGLEPVPCPACTAAAWHIGGSHAYVHMARSGGEG